jgi:hypothetical protein
LTEDAKYKQMFGHDQLLLPREREFMEQSIKVVENAAFDFKLRNMKPQRSESKEKFGLKDVDEAYN